MDYASQYPVICFGDIKQAALYFDQVFPPMRANQLPRDVMQNLFLGPDTPPVTGALEHVVVERTLNDMLFGKAISMDIQDGALIKMIPAEDAETILVSVQGVPGDERNDQVRALLLAALYRDNQPIPFANQPAQKVIKDYWSKLASNPSVILPECLLRAPERQEVQNDITVQFAALPLVDTTRASWEQILEIRRDRDAFKRLRDLRLFFHTSYLNRSRSYIEDDLARRLDNYERTARQYGFDTALTNLSNVIGSGLVQTTAAATLAFAVTGEKLAIATGIAAAVFASFELAKVGIQILRGHHDLRKLRENHELAYIIELKQRFGVPTGA